jgi:hypothetical protein
MGTSTVEVQGARRRISNSGMTRRGSSDEILFTRRTGDEVLIIGSIIEPLYSSGNIVAVWIGDLYNVFDIMSSH